MPKVYDVIGFAQNIESPPDSGIYVEDIVEVSYPIEIIKNYGRIDGSGQVNNNVTINNSFSIVADAYARANFHSIRYLKFNGVKWRIDSVDASSPPRLILAASSVYTEAEV